MSAILNTVFPIFGLILLGFLCRRTGRLGAAAASEINRFVVWLALPALLFQVTAASHWSDIWQPGFLIAFTGGALLVFVLTLLLRLRTSHLADASIDGLSASYPNAGFIGIPLCVLVLGRDALQPAMIATLLTACVMFAGTIVLIEVALQGEGNLGQAMRKVGRALATNPLVIAPVVGGLWAATGITLPTAPQRLIGLLADAASPCALISLGAFLAQKQAGTGKGASWIVFAKLVVQPLATAALAFSVFHLPTLWAASAVLLSALPTGTGPFMLAELYRREAAVVSRVVLVSTLISIATVSLCVHLFSPAA
ncbi:AEC family transporter [Chitinasiproducens palmae]|uniref:Transporter n=1 Tax=Chitinasiproducens palmae TaxID=1770053 RepID=A0A1H2PRH5_9BURK|nr:AEC family transporter [Chitinasiproducens palmae]SDV48666.1 hypothetical protein SAMN05216551_105280 [Chitinasiproducens palmae]